jgi:hypothetical protein
MQDKCYEWQKPIGTTSLKTNYLKRDVILKEENRFVSEIYHLIAPFIDINQQIFLMLDGEAARHGFRKRKISNFVLPDMVFKLVGKNKQIRI